MDLALGGICTAEVLLTYLVALVPDNCPKWEIVSFKPQVVNGQLSPGTWLSV